MVSSTIYLFLKKNVHDHGLYRYVNNDFFDADRPSAASSGARALGLLEHIPGTQGSQGS
jgi:hypothetical protein